MRRDSLFFAMQNVLLLRTEWDDVGDIMGVMVHDWHCATSRKVAGSIPDGVIGIFH